MKSYSHESKGMFEVLFGIMAALTMVMLVVAVVLMLKMPSSVQTVQTTSPPAVGMQTTAAVQDANGNLVNNTPVTQGSQAVTPQGTTVPGQTQPAQSGALSTSDIVNNMMTAVAQVKAPNASYTGHKLQVISIKLTDCSISSIIGLANSIIERLAGNTDKTFVFKNGQATDPESGDTVNVNGSIPPSDKAFTLDVNGVASATSEKSGNNTVYTVTLKQEQTSLASPVPKYHSMAMDYLDLASVDISPAKITQADITYKGAILKVTVDGNGKIVGFYENMPMVGTGEGKLGLSASGTIEGYLEETWTFTW